MEFATGSGSTCFFNVKPLSRFGNVTRASVNTVSVRKRVQFQSTVPLFEFAEQTDIKVANPPHSSCRVSPFSCTASSDTLANMHLYTHTHTEP